MNCIFLCVFYEKQYVDMIFLLLESIFIYGNLNENIDILIYTNTEFMNLIKQSHLFNKNILFEINDNYNSIDLACKSRLDLFNLKTISKYEKILYLDTDIIIKDDINIIFDVCKEDILYVLEEGTIDHNENFWGKNLFTNELEHYHDKSAFTSGILLFNNCEKIKNLFDNIKSDIINRPYVGSFNDQPYIVYNAFKYNLYNNKILKDYILNYDSNINNPSDKVVYHFPGRPENVSYKLSLMKLFLNNIKDSTIVNNINNSKKYIDNNLMSIINNSQELLEGNIFMFNNTTDYTDMFINKTKNISNLVLNKNIKNVLEIGFNSGFSTLLLLLSNSEINITCVDIGEHRYTLPCYEKLKETFGDRINIIIGDSTKVLQNIDEKFDLIHIDGGHEINVANTDIINSYKLSKKGTILIMDDYDLHYLHELWDNYIIKYNLQSLNINVYDCPYHDIKYVI